MKKLSIGDFIEAMREMDEFELEKLALLIEEYATS